MKIDFILCTNSDLWYLECKKYIDNLIIPDDVIIDIIGIKNASGMAAGYATGSCHSHADYKVYLHQDTFIINRHFIEDIDNIFRSNDRIGIIGVIGSDDVKNQSISWGEWQYGKVIGCNGIQELMLDYGEITESYRVVDCLDGMILVTRYDIPWPEDVCKGWHFYDRSICMEYRRKGYLCVVPRQERPWCIHDCGISALIGWNEDLSIFLEEYREYFQKNKVLEHIKMVDQNELLQMKQMAANIEILVNNNKIDEAAIFLREIAATGLLTNKEIIFLQNLVEIWLTGQYNMFFASGDSVADMKQKYVKATFLLRRQCFDLSLNTEERAFISILTEREKEVILRHELTLLHKSRQNSKKISFIIHVTHEMYEQECLAWLSRLEIPKEYSVDFLTVSDVVDMAAAYEEGRKASDARFKIYIEDRCFVSNRFLVQDLLTIFECDSTLGAVGIWGQDSLGGELGKVVLSDSSGTHLWLAKETMDFSTQSYDIAVFLREGLIATQYDLDCMTGKDVKAQSLHYRDAGYRIGVVKQRSAWCLLDQREERDVCPCLEKIVERERGNGKGYSFNEKNSAYVWYLWVKFQLRRIEYHFPQEDIQELLNALQCGTVSIEAVNVVQMNELLYGRRTLAYLKSFLTKPKVSRADGELRARGGKVIHVASAINRKYVRYVCVMLESLCRWHTDVEIHAWLLHGELEDQDKKLISEAMAGRRIMVDFLYVDKESFEKCRTTNMWSVEAYFRLKMMDLLPPSVDRLLYLDVDTLVLAPLYDLYFADFEGMDIIGCRDLGSAIPFGDIRDEIFADYLGQENFAYCNSGVMLWNVAKLRGEISSENYFSVMKERGYRLLAVDQDVINLVHAGRIKLVEAERYDFFARPWFFEADCEEIKSHVSILHYSGYKPWDGRCTHVAVDVLWWEVARHMPFYTSLLEDMLRGAIERDTLAG